MAIQDSFWYQPKKKNEFYDLVHHVFKKYRIATSKISQSKK